MSQRPHCDACALAKSHRISASQTPGSRHNRKRARPDTSEPPLSLEDTIASPLGSFAVDIKGPITPIGIFGYKYALIFTCISTRYRFIYYLKTKDETYTFTKSFISHVRQLGKNIRELIYDINDYDESYLENHPLLKNILSEHNITPTFTLMKSDNGTEFVNSDMSNLLEDNFIAQQTTSPHTPHQNGIAERSNRTIFELAVALLYDSNAPLKLWPYAAKHVIYILNRMPNKRLNLYSTPYTEVYKQAPDVSHLRTFGCDTYIVLPAHQQPSLGLRSARGIFIGFDEPRSLAYLVYVNNKVQRTGHAHFNEDLSTRVHTNNKLERDLRTLIQQVDNPLQSDATNATSSSLAPIEFSSFDNATAPDTQESANNDDAPTVETTINQDIDDPFIEAPALSTRSRSRVLYSNMPCVTVDDSMEAVLSGKHYDPDYELLFNSCFPLISCGVMTEDDAMRTPEQQQWKKAMHQELDKLNAIQTWSYVDSLPPGRKALKHKWVLKNKHDLYGNYIFKARLTVKGCAQHEGYDFDETFSPVAKISAVRLLLSLASAHSMILWQFDVQNAFVNAELTDVDIYMEIPEALREYYKIPQHTRYLKLLRALYGLKQSSREWNHLLVQILKEIGFTQLVAESCLFYITINGQVMYVVVYVDDMIIACILMSNIDWLSSKMLGALCLKF